MNELEFVDWMRRHGAGDLSDDCAVIDCRTERGPMLVTTDMLLDGTHFDLARHGARAVGRKSAACSLSDIAAMGGVPAQAFCSAGLPRHLPATAARELFLGLHDACSEFDVDIAGGDTTVWADDGRLAVSVTMIGWADGCRPIRRAGARTGDAVFVTGRLGGSLRGRHLVFQPRIKEARYLAQRGDVHAMMDVSDGLAVDLGRIVTESGCGATVVAANVPISADADERAPTTGKTPLEHALHDGEDFELLFTLPAQSNADLMSQWPFDTPLTHIGRIEADGLWMELPDGKMEPLEPGGYIHRFGEEG